MASNASRMAFGGLMTAVAVVIMSLGSLIPVNTYICPVICILITRPVMERCGVRLGWCYYMAVAILSLLLAPDREAAVVYLFLGYYPLIRNRFDRIRPRGLAAVAKITFFTLAGAAAYGLLLLVLGGAELLEEFRKDGPILIAVMILLWDVLFVLVDRLLGQRLGRRKK